MDTKVKERLEQLMAKSDPVKPMQSLLDFSRLDLDKLPAKRRAEQREKIIDLCAWSGPLNLLKLWKGYSIGATAQVAEKLKSGLPKVLRTKRELKAVQQKIQKGLRELFPEEMPPIDDQMREWHPPQSSVKFYLLRILPHGWPRSRSRKSTSRWERATSPKRFYKADWPALLWNALCDLIEECGPRLRRCPQCKKLFLRTKRQAYCSKPCSQRVRSEKFYFAHREDIKEKRRRAYASKVEARSGGKVRRRVPWTQGR